MRNWPPKCRYFMPPWKLRTMFLHYFCLKWRTKYLHHFCITTIILQSVVNKYSELHFCKHWQKYAAFISEKLQKLFIWGRGVTYCIWKIHLKLKYDTFYSHVKTLVFSKWHLWRCDCKTYLKGVKCYLIFKGCIFSISAYSTCHVHQVS